MNSKAIRSNKTSLPIAIYVHLADCQSQLIVNLSQLLILVRNWTKRLKGYLDPIRGCRVCLFDLFFFIWSYCLLTYWPFCLVNSPYCLFDLNVYLISMYVWLSVWSDCTVYNVHCVQKQWSLWTQCIFRKVPDLLTDNPRSRHAITSQTLNSQP